MTFVTVGMRRTFLHVWTPTKEAPSAIGTCTTCLDRARATKSAIADCCVLIHEMGILRTPAFAEVLYLHNLGKQRDIHRRFGTLSKVVTFENFLVLHQYHEVLSARNPDREGRLT
jgi:hypothetical protein